MALFAAHLNAGVILVVTARVAIGIYNLPLLPVLNKPYGFCGRYMFTYLLVSVCSDTVRQDEAGAGTNLHNCPLVKKKALAKLCVSRVRVNR